MAKAQKKERNEGDLLKVRLLNKNAMPTEVEYEWKGLEKRQKMAVWMNGYYNEVLERMPEGETKWEMIEQKKEYENFVVHHKAIVKEYYDRPETQELFKKEKKEVAQVLTQINEGNEARRYAMILFKAYDYGLENVTEGAWKKMAFMIKYH